MPSSCHTDCNSQFIKLSKHQNTKWGIICVSVITHLKMDNGANNASSSSVDTTQCFWCASCACLPYSTILTSTVLLWPNIAYSHQVISIADNWTTPVSTLLYVEVPLSYYCKLHLLPYSYRTPYRILTSSALSSWYASSSCLRSSPVFTIVGSSCQPGRRPYGEARL